MDGGLPIHNINVAGASSYAVTVKRHGLMLKIAKEFVEESTYPWINYWLRMAGQTWAFCWACSLPLIRSLERLKYLVWASCGSLCRI